MSQPESLNLWLKQALIRLIANRTGLKIRESDEEIFQEIILKRTRLIGVSFPESYYYLLESDTDKSQQEWKKLILEITNNESFFFRDKGQFKLLKDDIIPRLIRRKAETKMLRICSAGCSTGEEPYSVAILLKQLVPDLAQWDLQILGIDINSSAINKAKAGIYRPWSFRGVDKGIKQRFFREINGKYHIDPNIRKMVRFQTVNLLNDSFSDPNINIQNIDLILCRNVFIYFNEAAIKVVLNKFHDALLPLGYLLVGHAELYSQNPRQFQIKVFEESIAYQRPDDGVTPSKATAEQVRAIPLSPQRTATDIDSKSIDNIFEGQDSKMQKVALTLLKQLPANTKISRLGNLTASELILRIEQNMKPAD
ncbi:MAG: protein-glutamate O-methyltransferase CheR [Leptolyngbya sp. SIO1E4]|nr:protein-glutamate O-methyltransferase CheR [Leptolyngbya sp. SIO1E4]